MEVQQRGGNFRELIDDLQARVASLLRESEISSFNPTIAAVDLWREFMDVPDTEPVPKCTTHQTAGRG